MRPLRISFAAVTIILLTALCFLRASAYRDGVSLYSDTAAKSPNKARTLNNLGDALIRAGRLDEARSPLERAIMLDPGYADALNNLATVANRQGRRDEAVHLLGSDCGRGTGPGRDCLWRARRYRAGRSGDRGARRNRTRHGHKWLGVGHCDPRLLHLRSRVIHSRK